MGNVIAVIRRRLRGLGVAGRYRALIKSPAPSIRMRRAFFMRGQALKRKSRKEAACNYGLSLPCNKACVAHPASPGVTLDLWIDRGCSLAELLPRGRSLLAMHE